MKLKIIKFLRQYYASLCIIHSLDFMTLLFLWFVDIFQRQVKISENCETDQERKNKIK